MASILASAAHRCLVVPRAAAAAAVSAASARQSPLACRNAARSGLLAGSSGRRGPARAAASFSTVRPLSAAPPRRGEQRRLQSTTSTAAPSAAPSAIAPFAFAFDIDGVLLHVNEPIPGAAAALRHLHRLNIPFILLTNGGGRYEADRVADLQQRLGLLDADDANCGGPLPVLSTANFVQSHTPFQELLDNAAGLDRKASGAAAADQSQPGLRDQTILVTGSDAARIRTIAERYGFTSVVTPADILTAYPAIYPFDPLLKSVYAETARPLPKPLLLEGGKLAGSAPFSEDSLDASKYLRIAAAFVFNDPRDWAVDIQILTDLLQARRGFLGTFDPASLSAAGTPPHAGGGGARLFFSNSDLLWATTYHLPRFGQGAFAAATAGVWQQMVSPAQPPLLSPANGRATLLGKPHEATYLYAERTLTRYRAALLKAHGLLGDDDASSAAAAAAAVKPLQSVYMVGDNPDSDIAGANQFASTHGTDWCSVLVETGVYDARRYNGGSSSEFLRHKPRAIVHDVAAAVRWALNREGWPADF